MCREGFRGDGYICESLCNHDEAWEDGRCVQVIFEDNEYNEIEPICNILGACSCSSGYELDTERQMCRYVGNYDAEYKPEDLGRINALCL